MKMAGKWNNNHGRHCADFAVIYTAKRRVIFSILSALSNFFLSKLKWSNTVREYVVRLRRLGNHLHEQNISLEQLQDGFLDEILAPWLPTTSTNNYRIALRKYQHYQRQTCTGLVQKSSSLPSSDIY